MKWTGPLNGKNKERTAMLSLARDEGDNQARLESYWRDLRGHFKFLQSLCLYVRTRHEAGPHAYLEKKHEVVTILRMRTKAYQVRVHNRICCRLLVCSSIDLNKHQGGSASRSPSGGV